jgi:hypothetical protein
MPVKFKIDEARFFLQKINDSYKKSPDNKYYLSAFLSSAYSIKDHLLGDYNKKFHLGIKDNLGFQKNFEKKALEEANGGNITPFAFVLWYNKKNKAIREESLVKVLEKSRNQTIHSESIRVENLLDLMFNEGFPEQYMEQVKLVNPHLDITVFDTGDLMANVNLNECENILTLMEDFVKEALKKFPNELVDVEFQRIQAQKMNSESFN